MRKIKILFASCLALLASALPLSLQAETMNFIFLYPGGQGSQQQAQPLLDEFAAALKKASGDKIEAKIQYFNDLNAGETFIKSQKPAGGILAEDLFASKSKALGAEKILSTLPLPSGDGINQYFIFGNAQHPLSATGDIKLYSARPIDPSFLQQTLFPQLGARLQILVTPNTVGMLRKIGKGEEVAWVLLDQFESATITQAKAPWTKELKTEASSAKVPAAPWVVFTANIAPAQVQVLKNALLKVSGDGGNRSTLEMLRLKGFR